MRPRDIIEAEIRNLGRNSSGTILRKDVILFEILLDIRDGLYEDIEGKTEPITV